VFGDNFEVTHEEAKGSLKQATTTTKRKLQAAEKLDGERKRQALEAEDKAKKEEQKSKLKPVRGQRREVTNDWNCLQQGYNDDP